MPHSFYLYLLKSREQPAACKGLSVSLIFITLQWCGRRRKCMSTFQKLFRLHLVYLWNTSLSGCDFLRTARLLRWAPKIHGVSVESCWACGIRWLQAVIKVRVERESWVSRSRASWSQRKLFSTFNFWEGNSIFSCKWNAAIVLCKLLLSSLWVRRAGGCAVRTKRHWSFLLWRQRVMLRDPYLWYCPHKKM